MRFLVDASLPRSATELLRQCGHDAVDVRDIGLRSATDDVIAAQPGVISRRWLRVISISPTSETTRLENMLGFWCFVSLTMRLQRRW